MSTRVTRSRKSAANSTHQTQSPLGNTLGSTPTAYTETSSTPVRVKPRGRQRSGKKAANAAGTVEQQAIPPIADAHRPEVKATKSKSKSRSASKPSGKRARSLEPAESALKRAKLISNGANFVQHSSRSAEQRGKYLLPSLEDVPEGPTEQVAPPPSAEQSQPKSGETALPKEIVRKPTPDPRSGEGEDFLDIELESSASGSAYSSEGEDEQSSEESDLELIEKSGQELERQLTTERPTWTTLSGSRENQVTAKADVSSKKPKKDKKDNKSSTIKAPKQPNIEHPVWKAPAHADATSNTLPASAPKVEGTDGDGSLTDGLGVQGTGASRPARYELVYPDKPGPLNLLDQHADIQATARHSFARVERELLTTDAFPNTLLRRSFTREALIASAKALGYDTLTRQLIEDDQFARTLGAIPNQRISTFRSDLRDLAQNSVVAHYGLTPGSCAPKVEWLLAELVYIYPSLEFERNNGSWAKPYGHPLIVNIIQQAFFSGAQSLGRRFPDMFTSSLADRREELELPMAMVALVGTAIHAGLLQWRTGQFKKVEFSGNSFVDTYREHITLMTHTRTENARAYHTAMHGLYKAATGFIHSSSGRPAHTACAAIGRLAIDQMEVL